MGGQGCHSEHLRTTLTPNHTTSCNAARNQHQQTNGGMPPRTQSTHHPPHLPLPHRQGLAVHGPAPLQPHTMHNPPRPCRRTCPFSARTVSPCMGQPPAGQPPAPRHRAAPCTALPPHLPLLCAHSLAMHRPPALVVVHLAPHHHLAPHGVEPHRAEAARAAHRLPQVAQRAAVELQRAPLQRSTKEEWNQRAAHGLPQVAQRPAVGLQRAPLQRSAAPTRSSNIIDAWHHPACTVSGGGAPARLTSEGCESGAPNNGIKTRSVEGAAHRLPKWHSERRWIPPACPTAASQQDGSRRCGAGQ